MVVVARSVPVSVAAEVVAGGAFGAGVVRKADAGVGRVLHDGGSAGMVVAGFGCCWAKRCWSAMKSMRAMAVFLPLVAPQTLGHIRSDLNAGKRRRSSTAADNSPLCS